MNKHVWDKTGAESHKSPTHPGDQHMRTSALQMIVNNSEERINKTRIWNPTIELKFIVGTLCLFQHSLNLFFCVTSQTHNTLSSLFDFDFLLTPQLLSAFHHQLLPSEGLGEYGEKPYGCRCGRIVSDGGMKRNSRGVLIASTLAAQHRYHTRCMVPHYRVAERNDNNSNNMIMYLERSIHVYMCMYIERKDLHVCCSSP